MNIVGKVTPVRAMKASRDSRSKAALILDLRNRWELVVDF